MFNGANVSNSQNIVSEFFERNYPSGQSIVRRTSGSQVGVANKTLSSQSIEATVSLNSLFRDPRFVLTQRNRIIQSSLNDVVTAGLETVYSSGKSITVIDPESTDGVRTLTGAAAANRVLLDSVATSNAGFDFISSEVSYLNELARTSSLEAQGYNIVGPNGQNFQHGPETPIPQNAGTVSSGGRLVLTDSNFNEGEKEWYLERARLLNETGFLSPSGHLVNGFDFDLPDSFENLRTSGTYFPGLGEAGRATTAIPDSVVRQGTVKAYIAPALIEMLLHMSSDDADIKIGAGSGTHRGGIPEGQAGQGSGYTPLQSGTTSDPSYVTAHAMGRAADIFMVTSRDGTRGAGTGNNGHYADPENADVFKASVDIFFSELNSLGAYRPDLLPDQIIIHSGLITHYGIVGGLEGEDTAIKQMYPNLRYVNIGANDQHRDHIHITYSAERAGVYSGPGGSMGVVNAPSPNLLDGATGVGEHFTPATSAAYEVLTNPVYTNSYIDNPSATLQRAQVVELLYGTWCGLEAACLFAAIAYRESRYTPAALNPNVVDSGDFSNGLWQINFLPGATHGAKDYFLPVTSSGQLTGFVERGWHLAWTNWQAEGWTEDNYGARMQGLGSSYSLEQIKAGADRALWVPLNQAYMLYKVSTGKNIQRAFGSADREYVNPEDVGRTSFFPWGDYGGGGAVGWIYSVHFRDAYQAYIEFGGNGSDIQNWTLDMFTHVNTKSTPYAEEWVSGRYYDGKSDTTGTVESLS